jgi:hypothetical protein
MRKSLSFLTIFLATAAFARHVPYSQFPDAPWFTGPLLSASAHVTPPGQVNFEPIYFVANSNAHYESNWKKSSKPAFWINDLELYCTIGITDWMDLLLDPGVLYNISQGKQKFLINDVVVGLDFQLLLDSPDNYLPALKLGIRQEFPNGKYDHLNPHMHKTDLGGYGSYQTGVFLCAGRLFHIRDAHWLALRLTGVYTIQSRVHVKGYNIFGGAKDTDAYAYPRPYLDFDFAYEFTFSRNWAFACDNYCEYDGPIKSKGYPGRLSNGQLADLSNGSSIIFGLAPAIEYNWSADLGMIVGANFSVAGRNVDAFAGMMVGVNAVF